MLQVWRGYLWLVALCLLSVAPVTVAKSDLPIASRQGPGTLAKVEIRRTTDGIPHVRAQSWRDLGVGVGYAQAQDALCTLAEAFVTYRGQRAWFFGPESRPAHHSTFGRPKNLDLDFFFRALIDDAVVARYRSQQPAELNALIEGFAAGYNRYLADTEAGRAPVAARVCRGQPWLREITASDIYRRLYAAQLSAGYGRFIEEIANASPSPVRHGNAGETDALRARLARRIGDQPGLGSNVLAFGQLATRGDGVALLGNPHWFWSGPDRFYQMHLTIPGRLNAAGVAFLGVPIIMIGFNEQVAWSHTVSVARRFGLFDLSLDPDDPTRYRVDGAMERMTARQIGVDVRAQDGARRRVTRTLYRTRHGPMVDLGAHDAAFGWGPAHALSIRDINAENFRAFRNYFYWNQASSLQQFIAIQRREAAVSWVNTVAIGRDDGRVWYGDIGVVPDVPDALRKACTTALAQGFARIDPLTPVLDASRARCDWRMGRDAVQAGAMSASAQPWLLREDYVANMNDSYWLTNVRQPLEGFPALLGGEREPLELRGRLGHRIALDLLQKPSTSAAILSRRLMDEALTPRAYSAELFKDELLTRACTPSEVVLDATARAVIDAAGFDDKPQRADVGRACQTLRDWSNRADADDRGALLWEAFWETLQKMTPSPFYRVAFSSDAPLTTPAAPAAGSGFAAQALAVALLTLEAKGVAIDAPLGDHRFVDIAGRRLPIYGGCQAAGYFTVACSFDGKDRMGRNALANSYLQVVHFDKEGMAAYTLLAHGQDESFLADGRGSSPVARYARKDWLYFPFQEQEIAQDPNLTTTVLSLGVDAGVDEPPPRGDREGVGR